MVTGLVPTEYPFQAALEIIPGHQVGSRLGTNDSVPSSTFILLSNVTSAARPFNFPAAAQQMQIVSTDANDTAAGIGAQQVEIVYLTAPDNSQEPFKRKIEIVTTNGLVPVTTNATDIFRIDRVRVSRMGTNLFSAGNISVQSVGGATTYEIIDTDRNSFRSAIHFVPKGFGCVLTDMSYGCSTAGGTIFILEQTELDPSNNDVLTGQTQLELGNQGIDQSFIVPHVIMNKLGKIMYFAMVVRGRTANQQASGAFHFIDFPL